jgi:hypothetical protein
MSKKLVLLMLVPILLLVFAFIPVASATEIPPKDVGVKVWVHCYSETDQSTYASLRFNGAFVQVFCPPNSAEDGYFSSTCVYMRPAGVSRYSAEVKVGSHIYDWGGSYSPGLVPHEIGGAAYQPESYTHGEWELTACPLV